ncbi:MAG: adenosylcobinamide-phosphate synthase CbiB [Steroidobacteraceae bacterium]
MRAYLLIAAVLLDGLLGEPRRWHPLVGFGRIAQRIEARLNPPRSGGATSLGRIPWGYARGAAAVLLAVGPPVLAAELLERWQPLTAPIAVGLLYLAIGHRSLHEHAAAVEQALQRGELLEARRRVGEIVSRDTSDMDPHRIAGATVESLLENGNDALFGALFWFLVLGAPGALAYRLVNTLDAMWGYRTDRYRQFGWAAARLDDLMNLLPARLTALSYALVGHAAAALRCWRRQAAAWESPNAGPVMAAGAGALDIRLGGGAFYHGRWRERPVLGEGRPADVGDIARARQLVFRALLLWTGATALFVLSRRSFHA